MIEIFIQGFLLQASLILALGAQNIFVLNSGLRKQKHLLVALVSSICDMILVFTGVLGVATVFVRMPILKIILGIIGVGFLLFYGIIKLKEAKNTQPISPEFKQASTVRQAVLMSLGFSLLNPHVYLDTVVLIGGYSAQFSQVAERFVFGVGASVFSTFWFFGLSVLASVSGRLLQNNEAMRWIALISGFVLVILSAKLGSDVLSWIRADLSL